MIVTKKEKDSDRVLEGGVFALCAKEDIKNTDGDDEYDEDDFFDDDEYDDEYEEKPLMMKRYCSTS